MSSTPSSTSAGALPRWLDVAVLPVLNLALALAAAGAVVLLIGQDPRLALRLLLDGALGSALGWGYTLYYATNFIFTGLAVALAYHGGLLNIGAEGQATLGGLGVGLVLLAGDAVLPAPVLLPLALLGGLLAGMAWALIPAWLQAWRGSHVVVTTIMFNFMASALMVWLLVHGVKVPSGLAVESRPFAVSAALPDAQQLAALLGIELPATPLNLSFALALLACLGLWLLLWRTRLGYAVRALGLAPEAARYAGMDTRRLTLVVMCLSGALAGGVGLNEIAGVHHKLLLDFVGGAGFTGIAVALMGRNHPVGVLLAALLFGVLYQGGAELAFEMPSFTRDMVVTVQGFVVLFSGALALMLRPLVVWCWQASLRRRKAALAVQEG